MQLLQCLWVCPGKGGFFLALKLHAIESADTRCWVNQPVTHRGSQGNPGMIEVVKRINIALLVDEHPVFQPWVEMLSDACDACCQVQSNVWVVGQINGAKGGRFPPYLTNNDAKEDTFLANRIDEVFRSLGAVDGDLLHVYFSR